MKTTITILSVAAFLSVSSSLFAQNAITYRQTQRGGIFTDAATKPLGIKASSVLEPLENDTATVTNQEQRGSFSSAATKPAGISESSVLEPFDDVIPVQKGGNFTDAATKPFGIANSSILEPLDDLNVIFATK